MALATTILEAIGNKLWGFKPNLMKDIVDQQGGTSSVVWFARNMPKYEKILNDIGPIRTHLLATAISGINACPYCTYGHGYAFQLHYFKNTGKLFPIDESEMMNFNTLEEEEVVERLKLAYHETGLKKEIADLERMIVLKENPEEASTKMDNHTVHLIKMFKLLNSCGINANTKEDFAHDPINKDAELIEVYNKARGSLA